ncbi:hypothetical protein WJX79_005924 [Trebouxia sp. C0005]
MGGGVLLASTIFEDSSKMAVRAAAHPHSQCTSSPSQLEDVLSSTRTRRSLFRPTNPVTKYLHPHLSTGNRSYTHSQPNCICCAHASQVLTKTTGHAAAGSSKPQEHHGARKQNWLHDTSAKATLLLEEHKLPQLGSPQLAHLRQSLAGKIERKASQPKRVPASADFTTTSNGAATYASSGSARTDLFFKVKEPGAYLPASSEDTTHLLLQQAWEEDPLDTLKLIAHLRDVRDGKADRNLFHDCIAWLWEHHPLTLLANLDEIVKVGYWKDLLEILVRACVSAEELQKRKTLQGQVKNRMKWGTGRPDAFSTAELQEKHPELNNMCAQDWRKHYRSLKTEAEREEARAQRAKQAAEKAQIISKHQAQQRQKKKKQLSSNVTIKYADGGQHSLFGLNHESLVQGTNKFQLLRLSVAVAFAEQLQLDSEAFTEGRLKDVSLAAKWAPTPQGSHDKDTFIASSIAQLLFPLENSPHTKNKHSSHAAHLVHAKSQYRKMLAPLRRCLNVPEVYMCANEWQDVKYTRVPSVCMKNNKGSFEAHDKQRFTQYLENVQAGKQSIASGALTPHELVAEAMQLSGSATHIFNSFKSSSALSVETMELQWKDYVAKLKASGTLSSALAIADVSPSMEGLPMQVSIALSLLVAEVAGPPFHNTVLTFSTTPQLHAVRGTSLVQKVRDLEDMDWTGSTDVDAAFDLILERACDAKVSQEQMIETLFIFSDMQFDEACQCGSLEDFMSWTAPTNFKVAQAKFEEHGYKLPKVVFWNLRGHGFGESASVPVTQTEEGTALVSGFSGQLLKLFMDDVNELVTFNPFNVMKQAIGNKKYDNWKVVD